jgi:hypothetical protein
MARLRARADRGLLGLDEVPMWTCSSSFVPGPQARERPMIACGPISAPSSTQPKRSKHAVLQRRVDDVRRALEPTAPPMRVAPRSVTFGPMTVSGPIVTSGAMYAVAGSSKVTPAAMWRSITSLLSIDSILASSARVFTPSTSAGRSPRTACTRPVSAVRRTASVR